MKDSDCEFNGTESCNCNKPTYIKDYFETAQKDLNISPKKELTDEYIDEIVKNYKLKFLERRRKEIQ